jgi:hypothetical protein
MGQRPGSVHWLTAWGAQLESASREQRRSELEVIWRESPTTLVGLYRRAIEKDILEPLPRGSTLAAVFDSIIDYEHGRKEAK